MKVRRYIGKNAQEAILKVKMDLGSEAVILNTKKIRQKGIMRYFTKPLIEVLAAIEDSAYHNKEGVPSHRDNDMSSDKEDKIKELESKFNNMDSLLKKIYNSIQNTDNMQLEENGGELPYVSNKILACFYNNMLKNEVDDKFAKEIIDSINEKLGDSINVNSAATAIHEIIEGVAGKPETIKIKEEGGPTIVIFVGPTGVGKTTTLAKIAANFTLNQSKNVGLITADTYRIAAVEQLKTYGEILNIPVSVIYSADELNEAVKNYEDKDVILVDTAGRSHRHKAQFDELKALILSLNADEIYLVISAAASMKNCIDVINSYEFIDNYKLIFTKLDEAPVSGNILNLIHYSKRKLSYFTMGQSVPDDIKIAEINEVLKNIIGSMN